MLRLAVLAAGAYVAICFLLVLSRNRLIFPAPKSVTPEPRLAGIADGEKVAVATADGERLVGWYLPARDPVRERSPALLWFHGNYETVGSLAAILGDFRPEGAALLVVDYRGYGESTGRPTVELVKRDAEAAWAWLEGRPEVDASRIVVYGRSVGAGPAIYLAAARPAAGLILESAFTSLRGLARVHYPLFPSFLAGSGFDNSEEIGRVTCPVLFVHGERDRTVPLAMGRELAGRVGDRGEFYVIRGADHNDTYGAGGKEYTGRVGAFVAEVTR
ncbi:MAG: alpha/beta hydrolase [Gemmatimonadetes bacterium]|nr:alpha/beta hydrolase [Gemmatimonadota bacterium]